jgi:outer membrane protein assembly factor BamB
MIEARIFAVVPILVGPLQVLLALLPAILAAVGGALLGLLRPSTTKQSLKVLWRLKLPLLVVVASVFGLVHGVRAILPKHGIGAAEAGGGEWAMFHGGPQRVGAAAGSPVPLRGGANWAFKGEMSAFFSSPAVVGNRIYVTGADKGVFADRGMVYCLDADTGAVIWKVAPDGFRATFSSPSVAGKYLIVGEGLHYTHDSRVFCLDVTQAGKVLWSHRTASHVESTACIANGRAYIGAGDDGYYCFSLEPDSQGRAQVLWHVAGDRAPDAETSPVVHEGQVFIGLGLGGNALLCLDANSGTELWRVPTPYPVFTPPTVRGDRVFFGTGNGNFVETADEVASKELARLRAAGAGESDLAQAAERLKAAGEVWCVDIAKGATHEVVWRFKTSEVVLGAIAAEDDGKLYFGTRKGRVHCVDGDGRELVSWDAHSPILASPAVSGDYLYVVSENGRLFALERHTLTPVWETAAGSEGPALSSPAIARGHVYVGSHSGGLLCLGSPQDSFAKPAWAGAGGGPGRPGHLDDSTLPDRGALLWNWPAATGQAAEAITAPRICSPAAVLGGLLCVPLAQGPRRGLLALKNESASSAMPPELWFWPASNGVWSSPAIAEGKVFFVDGKRGDAGRCLHCVEGKTGAACWQTPVAADASGEFVLAGGFVLVQAETGALDSFDSAGQLLWRADLGELRGPPAACDQLAAVALASPPSVAVLDLPTGVTLWRMNLVPTTGAVFARDLVLVGAAAGVTALRLTDGSLAWEASVGKPVQPLLLLNNVAVTTTAAGELVQVEISTGVVTTRLPGASVQFSPVLTRDAILFAGKDGFFRAALGTTSARRWLATAGFGEITSPPILVDSAVYFATATKGFIKAGRLK